MTKTSSPTCMLSELPSFAGTALYGTQSSFSKATSAGGTEAITFAGATCPSTNSTSILSAAWTTCAAVKIFPSPMKMPDPSPGELTKIGCGARRTFFSTVLITTTEASTWRTTSRIGCALICAAPVNALIVISAERIKNFIFDHLRFGVSVLLVIAYYVLTLDQSG